jgi:hypothetical protein
MMTAQYDGRTFADPAGDDAPVAHYHQQDDLVWGEFAGGPVRRGFVVGTCDTDGVLSISYCMVLRDGAAIAGSSRSTPSVLDDGRLRLTEEWQRYGSHRDSGVSFLEEVAVDTDQARTDAC